MVITFYQADQISLFFVLFLAFLQLFVPDLALFHMILKTSKNLSLRWRKGKGYGYRYPS